MRTADHTPPILRLLVALAVGIHVYVIGTIAAQPLDVNHHPSTDRSVLWPLHHDMIHRIGPGADFFAVYHAGVALRQGHSPYDSREAPQVTPYYFAFRYLPVVAQTLGRLLSGVSPRAAYGLWIGVLEAILLALVVTLRHRIRQPRRRCVLTGVLLLSSPYALEVHMGQFTFVTLSLLAMSILMVEQPRGFSAGLYGRIIAAACYLGAVLLKVFPLIAVPALIRHRRYWPSLALVLLVLPPSVLSIFTIDPAAARLFYQLNFANSPWTMHAGNFGFLHVAYLVLGLGQASADGRWLTLMLYWRPALVALTASTVLFSGSQRVAVGVGALIFSHFLSYADVWEHHMSGAVVIGALVLWATAEEPLAHSKATGLAWCCVVLLALPTPFALFDRIKDPEVWDPSIDWSSAARCVLVLSKVAPMSILYALWMIELLRAGFVWPWASDDTRRAFKKRDVA